MLWRQGVRVVADGALQLPPLTRPPAVTEPIRLARSMGVLPTGKFDGTTNNRTDFVPHEVPATRAIRPSPAFEQDKAPFQGQSTYQGSFVPKVRARGARSAADVLVATRHAMTLLASCDPSCRRLPTSWSSPRTRTSPTTRPLTAPPRTARRSCPWRRRRSCAWARAATTSAHSSTPLRAPACTRTASPRCQRASATRLRPSTRPCRAGRLTVRIVRLGAAGVLQGEAVLDVGTNQRRVPLARRSCRHHHLRQGLCAKGDPGPVRAAA